MSISLKNTKDYASKGVKILLYGEAGSGKTSLIKTVNKPLILSVEDGLLSIKDSDIDYINTNSLESVNKVLDDLEGELKGKYQTIVLDSISELADLAFIDEKKNFKDGRLAYTETANKIKELLRRFKSISGYDVYVIARLDKEVDEFGVALYAPAMPSKSLGRDVQYFFDEIFALRVERDAGKIKRALLTQRDDQWMARDNAGKLDRFEKANLGFVISKIKGEQQ